MGKFTLRAPAVSLRNRGCMITAGRRRSGSRKASTHENARIRRQSPFRSSRRFTMLTQRLAEFVIETKSSDIPSDVMDAARDALIDTLGVGIVGSTEEVGEIALRYVSGMEAKR